MKRKRGDVWWVNFDPSVGTEIQKLRPAVIVSSNAANQRINRCQVIPLTSQTKRIYPADVLLNFNRRATKAAVDQLTTVDASRFSNKAGELTQEDMQRIEAMIIIQLDLRLAEEE